MSTAVDAPVWPQYGRAVHVGTSANGKVSVYFDPHLGQPGLQNARDLITDADRVVAANDRIFGTASGAVNVIVFALGGRTDGTGGADHMACDFVNGGAIEVCAAFGAAFLSWLLSQGHTLHEAARAMVALGAAGTLAQLYADLTGDSPTNAWDSFSNAVHALPAKITTDDPFAALPLPAQRALRNPGTTEPLLPAAPVLEDPACSVRSHRLLTDDLDYPDELASQL